MTEETDIERVRPMAVLDEMAPFLVPVGSAFKEMSRRFERETGAAAPKWLVLTLLSQSDGISQGEASREFDLDPSRLTRLGGALEKEGLIDRERDPKDNRVVRMYLTAKGREKLEEIPAFSEGFRRRVGSVLNRDEQRELRRMLGLLADAMRVSEVGT